MRELFDDLISFGPLPDLRYLKKGAAVVEENINGLVGLIREWSEEIREIKLIEENRVQRLYKFKEIKDVE